MSITSNKNFGLILSIMCIIGFISCGGGGGSRAVSESLKLERSPWHL